MIEILIAVAGTLLLISAGGRAPKLAPQPVRDNKRRR
jgi:hypothetical protein